MAKKPSGKTSGKSTKKGGTSVARTSSAGGGRSSGGGAGGFDASEAFIKLLQSPLAAELVAVAATAALAALAEHGFTIEQRQWTRQTRRQGGEGGGEGCRRCGRAPARHRARRDPEGSDS